MKRWMALLSGALLLVGCSGMETTETVPAQVPVVAQETKGTVIAEAVIEPAHWSEIRPVSDGVVVEVLVAPGDEVAVGDLLVQLDPTDAELAVQEAEAAFDSAQAQLALLKSGPRAEEIAVSEAQLEAAKAALSRSVAQRDELTAGATDAEIAAARADLAAAQAEQRQAQEQHDQTMKCYSVTKSDGTKDEVCPALGTLEELARYNLHAANEALAAAQAKLDAAQGGADTRLRDAQGGVWSAIAQQNVSQAQLDLLKAGSAAEEIAAAEATAQQAEVSLAAAKVVLERTGIRAPLAGTVTQVNLDAGDIVAPGEVIMVLATLDQLQARTTDLTELNVVRVTVGQPAVVIVDALPGQEFAGVVHDIALQPGDYRGDVVYAVTIELTERDLITHLRWGMRALVEIYTG
ncbi:MAG: biotin/lipoyl-binding protein [Chloroflexota bacterium]|nr:biotin/lipoyl-binding protein [Chloroflexota bacterium]